MLTYISPVFKLIILFLYNTSSPKIITNRYRYFFSLYSIFNYFTIYYYFKLLIALFNF